MQKFGVPCPYVVTLKKHILVMSLIGNESPAPKLRDANLSVPDLQDAYEQTVEVGDAFPFFSSPLSLSLSLSLCRPLFYSMMCIAEPIKCFISDEANQNPLCLLWKMKSSVTERRASFSVAMSMKLSLCHRQWLIAI